MSHRRKGQLTVSGEWARHLRPFLRRMFWKAERQADKVLVRSEEVEVGKEGENAGRVADLLRQ